MKNVNKGTINMQSELLEGCRRNNRKSQLQVYNLYYKAMFNTAFRIVKNSAEAEDIMQEAFLTAFRKIEDYKGDATLGAWLKRIVVNRAIDQFNKKQQLVSLDEVSDIPAIEDNNENYLEILSYKIDQIRFGIERLPDDDRIVLSLFLLEGYDHDEISEILNISNNASRTRFSRAKQRLRELLSQEHIDQLVN